MQPVRVTIQEANLIAFPSLRAERPKSQLDKRTFITFLSSLLVIAKQDVHVFGLQYSSCMFVVMNGLKRRSFYFLGKQIMTPTKLSFRFMQNACC